MRAYALACAVALASGCASVAYSGGAHTVDPARLVTEPGWVSAGYVPALRQRAEADCGAASLAMVAGRWDMKLDVTATSAVLPPAHGGARLGDMRDFARTRGLQAFAIAGDRETLLHELAAHRPVIVGLMLPFGKKYLRKHYTVIVAANPTKDEFVAIDPAKGWRIYKWADLDAEWRPAGRPTLVVLGPREEGSTASR